MSGGGTLLQLNLRRETWCQVEGKPRQSWDRPERRHYRAHRQTGPVLRPAPTGTELQTPAKRPQRKHFEESYKSHLV
ncbi:spermatogenesis-associated protein 45 [Embiotoca jacksoni]|uniref:spermatogenesis-associated protein 45 n=1 Tax=Embiotoca jacksoni TaxID=100190 RepID=UPI00370493E2